MPAWVVPSASVPQRLDVFITRQLPGTSRRRVRELIAKGAVRLNGRRQPKGALVRGGDVLEIPAEALAPTSLAPNTELAIAFLYADDDVVVVDKPPGLPSHALRMDERDTVANFLVAHFPEMAALATAAGEAGLVHRLDTGTSGVLVAARSEFAYAELRRQFSAHTVVKEYLAVVGGDVAVSGEVAAPIAHDRGHRGRMRVCSHAEQTGPWRARPALTRYHPQERAQSLTLLAIEIRTGVTHQIRVHLASIGHPIVGDALYGGIQAERLMLHAARIRFAHPRTGSRILVESPRPTALDDALHRGA